jgi:hypothetical protein
MGNIIYSMERDIRNRELANLKKRGLDPLSQRNSGFRRWLPFRGEITPGPSTIPLIRESLPLYDQIKANAKDRKVEAGKRNRFRWG